MPNRKQTPDSTFLMIGKCFAGNGRLSDGTTLRDKYPERYDNPLAQWIDLLIAQAKADHAYRQAQPEPQAIEA